jgi:hypothetical protein
MKQASVSSADQGGGKRRQSSYPDDLTKGKPHLGDQHHGGVAMAVAIGPGSFDEAVDFGVGQVFTRPHLGIVYPFGRPAAPG